MENRSPKPGPSPHPAVVDRVQVPGDAETRPVGRQRVTVDDLDLLGGDRPQLWDIG